MLKNQNHFSPSKLFSCIALATIFAVAGCGGDNDSNNGGSNSNNNGGSNSNNNGGGNGNNPSLSTALGDIVGVEQTATGSNEKAEVFLKVPYAQPPVGDLRWRPPVVSTGWSGTLDATQPPPMCPQGTSGVEDCLYANIYRPIGTKKGDNKPVMVYAYGGGNTGGSANGVSGVRMAAINDIIVVAINYRIGALGFMASPAIETVEQQSGNYGVLDTRAALQWVKTNIAEFGGDPNNITLASQSSGSTNTCRLLVDPAASGLFQAAILASEDCIHDVDTKTAAQKRAVDLTTKLGCSSGTAQNVIACLRGKSAQDIAALGGAWNPYSTSTLKHGWAVEQIEAGSFNKVPVLVGSTRDEGRSAGAAFVGDIDYSTDIDFGRWATRLITRSAQVATVPPNDLNALLQPYWPMVNYTAYPEKFRVAYAIGDFITDSGMRGLGGCTNYRLAAALARNNVNTWFYQFESIAVPPLPDDQYNSLSSHGSEVAYLWSANPGSFSAEQLELSDQMIRYWGAFARTHDLSNVANLPAWPKLTSPVVRAQQMWLRRPDDNSGSAAREVRLFYDEHNCNLWLKDPDKIIIDRGDKGNDLPYGGTDVDPVVQLCNGKTTTSCQ